MNKKTASAWNNREAEGDRTAIINVWINNNNNNDRKSHKKVNNKRSTRLLKHQQSGQAIRHTHFFALIVGNVLEKKHLIFVKEVVRKRSQATDIETKGNCRPPFIAFYEKLHSKLGVRRSATFLSPEGSISVYPRTHFPYYSEG